MDESDQLRLRRIARQRLESLQRSGIQHILRHPLSETEQAATATKPPQDTDHQPQSVPSIDSGSTTEPRESPVLTLSERQSRLQKMGKKVSSCELCPELVAHRTQTVFGVGNPKARLCFFGEAPGADEDQQGEPFVGRAGQLLDKIIEACTLHRDDVYILNVLKCRPPGNRNPSPEETQNCRPFFEKQLEIIRPEFICCLGSVAATTLLETKLSIGKLRGELHEWRWAKVLATYHPAYLLRNPNAKRDVWNDMQILLKEMGIKVKK
ncbi:MAG: uracil-DNA glycosylase [Pirellulaceae bacterium]|nr:uracil-DNA glycosylase [Pirellulaceae bacterium]